MSDLINRQDAIDAFYVQSDDDGWWYGTAQDAEELLKGLPSAEPEHIRCGLTGILGDYLVSIQDVIAITAETGALETQRRVKELKPFVQPKRKTGKWIGSEFDGYADGYPVYCEWKCSACGVVVEDEEPTWNYCPNCGAKMEA